MTPEAETIQAQPGPAAPRASVNGVALHAERERLAPAELRQRACLELLRQRAQDAGLLAASDAPSADGVISDAASDAIERLLARELHTPEPSEEACRRYHAAHPELNRQGERAHVRHILFAVTPGVNAMRLAQRAEAVLLDARCADTGVDRFAAAAREWSNCPSGGEGGDLGWLTRADCAPEFAQEIFSGSEIGVLSRLVRTRFGLHVVEIRERDAGRAVAFEDVHAAVAQRLRQQAWNNALRQYLQLLAGAAELEGVAMDAAATPLVQ